MNKKEALRHWQLLEGDQPILPHFTPIAAGAKGSTIAITQDDSVVEKQRRNADMDAETCHIQVRERMTKARRNAFIEQSRNVLI